MLLLCAGLVYRRIEYWSFDCADSAFRLLNDEYYAERLIRIWQCSLIQERSGMGCAGRPD
jgi:hypothetical protein